MDARDQLEIYIPVEAEVKSIPLQSLPASVLRRIALPLPDSAPRKSADSQQVIWICPTVIGRKGQGVAWRKGGAVGESARSLLGAGFRERPDPLQMSFVSSNRAAFEVLKGISPGTRSSNARILPQGSAPLSDQNAVVVHRGRVYLCIRSTGQKKPASKRCRKQLQRDGRPAGRRAAGRGSLQREEDAALERTAVPVSVEAGSPSPQEDSRPPPPAGGREEDGRCMAAAGGRRRSEEAAVQLQQEAEDDGVHMQHAAGEEAAIAAWSFEQSSSSMWSMSEPLGGAASSLSLEFDFNELEQEEKIAQMRARVMESEAALKSLLS